MSETFVRIKALINQVDWAITEHAYASLADEEIAFENILSAVNSGIVIEDYPEYHKGPAVLILTKSQSFPAIHSLWGIPAGETRPATLITAYIPDPKKWETDLITRKTK